MGKFAGFASDMYSFGVLFYFMHFPKEFSIFIPSQSVRFPPHADADLCDLIQSLITMDPLARLSAATALTHPYFRATFVDRLLQEGEIVEQDRKLEAVRNLLSRTRQNNRNIFDRLSVSRSTIVSDTIAYFTNVPLENLRKHLKVTFNNEPGVDEGGLLTEMFTLFFEAVFSPYSRLFEDCYGLPPLSHSTSASTTTAITTDEIPPTRMLEANHTDYHHHHTTTNANLNHESFVVLPAANLSSPDLIKIRAVGRAMVKALYEGRRIGNRLCPSVLKFFTNANPTIRDLQLFDSQSTKSLQWLLTTMGVEELGLHYEEVDKPELGAVTDSNKANYVKLKVHKILIDDRLSALTALKTGFMEALQGLSTEAAPFLTLLSYTDWRLMLCGEAIINPQQIVACLKFSNFPRRSKIPQWLTEVILSASEDHLRKFLVFVTGSPSLTGAFTSSALRINVRYQSRSSALPTAHTCFYFLDIPDYDDKEIFQNKLFFAIQHANTFEIV
jgi:hypothetical protein